MVSRWTDTWKTSREGSVDLVDIDRGCIDGMVEIDRGYADIIVNDEGLFLKEIPESKKHNTHNN